MARLRRLRSVSAWLAKALVVLVSLVLVFVGIGVATIETGWAKNRIRDLIVRQANRLRRKDDSVAPTPPATRDCPYCLSAIAAKARRCPHCTSELAAA